MTCFSDWVEQKSTICKSDTLQPAVIKFGMVDDVRKDRRAKIDTDRCAGWMDETQWFPFISFYGRVK
jgi:hypothetical protein